MPEPRRLLRRVPLLVGALALAAATVVATATGLTESPADRGTSADHARSTTPAGTARAPASAGRTVAGQAVPVESAPVLGTAPPGSATPAAPTTTPVWSDDFDGPAGTAASGTVWRADTGGGGWGNDELECNTDSRDNSALDGAGHLVITAVHDPGHTCADGSVTDYTSARLSTADLVTMHYGSLRIRAQLPSASGLWPGIWALGADHASVGWPQSGEIDVAEAVGTTPDTIYQTLHGPDRDGGSYSLGTQYSIGRPTSTGFHTYGVDWTPDRIVFSVDGDAYATFTRAQVEQHGSWVFDQPFYLLLDVAVGGTFPGPPEDTSVFPQQMLVDFVRVYA